MGRAPSGRPLAEGAQRPVPQALSPHAHLSTSPPARPPRPRPGSIRTGRRSWTGRARLPTAQEEDLTWVSEQRSPHPPPQALPDEAQGVRGLPCSPHGCPTSHAVPGPSPEQGRPTLQGGARLAVLMFEGGHSQMWGAGRRLGQPTTPSGGRGSGVKWHQLLISKKRAG